MKPPYRLSSIVGVLVGSDLVFMWRSDAVDACNAGKATYPEQLTKPTHLEAEPMLRNEARQARAAAGPAKPGAPAEPRPSRRRPAATPRTNPSAEAGKDE
jgi:hypothetical protein